MKKQSTVEDIGKAIQDVKQLTITFQPDKVGREIQKRGEDEWMKMPCRESVKGLSIGEELTFGGVTSLPVIGAICMRHESHSSQAFPHHNSGIVRS